jgi:hypothetical protein
MVEGGIKIGVGAILLVLIVLMDIDLGEYGKEKLDAEIFDWMSYFPSIQPNPKSIFRTQKAFYFMALQLSISNRMPVTVRVIRANSKSTAISYYKYLKAYFQILCDRIL